MKPTPISFFSLLSRAWLGLLLLTMAGCSSFHQDWKRAATAPAPNTDISGRWDGQWHSEANGHSGRLRCLVTKTGNGDFQARFHANFWKVFSFGYTVNLQAQENDGVFHFQGEADLGRLAGGKYIYEGDATRTNFFSIYRAKGDHGKFQMNRP